MTTPPRKWSTDTNYSSGVDTGTPTRVDPGAGLAAQGFIPHEGVPAQHVNSLFGETIDYLHALIEDRDTFAELEDDFFPGHYDSGDDLVHTSLTWKADEYVAGVVDPSAGSLVNPGQARCDIATTEGFVLRLGAEFGDRFVQWGNVQEVLIVAAVTSTVLTGDEMFVGLADQISFNPGLSQIVLGNDAVGLWFRRATSANWMVRHKVGGVDDATVTSVPVVSGEFVVLKIRRVSATSVQIFLNGTLAATLTDGSTGPADAAPLTVGQVGYAGGGDTLAVLWDKIYLRWATPSRAS